MSTVNVSSGIFDQIKAGRKPARGKGGVGALTVDDADAFPCLTHLLTTLPHGAPRGAKPGRIGIYVWNGRLSVCIALQGLGSAGFYTAAGFSDLLTRLEAAVADGKIEWREDDK